ncbi:hypothetical protein C8R44DRAFT_783768 [Mycena epipterygia]|nr:hypothetical protein C8R44DRAFT_783768 [Mycena epipterygia]
MPAYLAQELLDCIVGEVQDRKTLKAWSLVARSFTGSSQRRLFRSLCLFTGRLEIHPTLLGIDHLTALTSFERALELFTITWVAGISPHLGSYAKGMHLGLINSQDFGVVESVLRMAPQITVLGIFGNRATSGRLHWGSFPVSLAALMKEIALRPTVRSMILRWIAGVPSSLILVPSFRALTLHDVSIEEDITSTSPFISPLLHPAQSSDLEVLVITPACSQVHKSAIQMDTSGHLTGLRKLSLPGILSDDPAGWMPFMLKSDFRHTLKHLELLFVFTASNLVRELPPFPALTSLELVFVIYDPILPDTLDAALSNLHTVAPLLEYLSVALKGWIAHGTWAKNCEPYPLFASLDFMKRLPALREVHCSLAIKDCVDTGFEQHMGDKFSGPMEAGILTCSIL